MASPSLVRTALQASSSRTTVQLLASATASSSSTSTRAFSSCPAVAAASRGRIRASAKRNRHIAAVAARAAQDDPGQIDFVLGYQPRPNVQSPWEGCRLQRVLLRPEAVYNAPAVDYAEGQEPEHYIPGLSTQDRDVLFGALPYTSTALKARRMPHRAILASAGTATGPGVDRDGESDPDPHAVLMAQEEGKVEQMRRMLDLRNSNKKGIEVLNRQRVIQEFGGVPEEGKGENTGSSEVQAALLTQKIRSVAEHLQANKRDIANRRAIRSLVHQRQQVLKYFARKNTTEKYEKLLSDLGLEKRAVEGEITL